MWHSFEEKQSIPKASCPPSKVRRANVRSSALSDRISDSGDSNEDQEDNNTEEIDDDEEKFFCQVPIQDEWRELFDKYDPEGFGEVPVDVFEVALDSRDFVQLISPGKLIILQDRLQQHRELGLSAVTFQDFVNTLSGKRTLSFKCAIHCRDRQVCKDDDFKLKREVSIYSIGDLLKETVANETLPDRHDRKYFMVTHKKKCCRPPPLFVPAVSLLQVVLFFVYLRNKSENPLVLHPHRMEEIWRYLTYCLVHIDWIHLLVNVVVQLFVGVPLEFVHGTFRMMIIYFAGVLSGSVSASVFDSTVHLAGAGGGVYALLSAHLANIILHYASLSQPQLRCVLLMFLASVEVGFGVYRRYVPESADYPQHSFVAHLAGVFAGLTVGLVILRNYEQRLSRCRSWWAVIVLMLLLSFGTFLYHYLHKNDAFKLFCNTKICV